MKKNFSLFLVALCFCASLWVQAENAEAFPPIQRTVLPNQLVVLVSGEHSLPFLTLQLLVDAGSGKDPAGEEGLARLTAKGLLLGTARRTAKSINEELDFMGASLDSSAGRDYMTLSLRVLKKDLQKGLDLFREVLTQPIFPEEEIKKEVEKTLAAIQAEEDQAEVVAEKAFQKHLYAKGPYRHPVEGTKESLPRIKREAMLRFYREYYHPGNSILAAVGDITPGEIKARLLPLLEKWPAGKTPRVQRQSEFAEGPATIKIDRPLTQANIILGQRGVARDNPDYYSLTVANYILGGGGFSSRLMESIRNRKGLAYSVASFFEPGKYPGSFQIVLQTQNSSAKDAIALARDEIGRIRKEEVSVKELEAAQKYLVGSFPMRFDTQGKLANFLLQVEYYRLGLDYPERYPRLIQKVTREEILRVSQKYFHPDALILVVVGNLKAAGLE
jgi:zinc protease